MDEAGVAEEEEADFAVIGELEETKVTLLSLNLIGGKQLTGKDKMQANGLEGRVELRVASEQHGEELKIALEEIVDLIVVTVDLLMLERDSDNGVWIEMIVKSANATASTKH